MYALGYALGKTSLISKVKSTVSLLNGKKDMLLVLCMFALTILFGQFLPGTVTISIMLIVLGTLGSDGVVTSGKILLPLLMIECIWECVLPIGMGATIYMMDNAMVEGIIQNEAYAYQIFDYVKVAMLPAILLFLYAAFIWKKIPDSGFNEDALVKTNDKNAIATYKPWQEVLIYVLFAVTIICLICGQLLGDFMYLVPAIAVLILAFTKIMTTKEIIANVTADTVWMIAGIMVVSTALGNSGAGDIIGNFILNLLGGTTNGFIVMLVVCVVTVLMTTFLSNTGTYLVMMPIAASVAAAAGMDPRGICLCCSIGSVIAFAFPTGSTTCALVYAAGNYNPFKLLKYTLPGVVIGILSLVVSAYFWFPPM